MSNASMFYREIPAPQEISHLVLSFWEFLIQGENHEPIVHEVFPDGCISLVYKRNKIFGIDGLFSHGLSLKIFKTEVQAGDVFWGIRFMPSACAKILRLDPAQVESRPLDETADFTHLIEGSLEKLVACENFDEAVKVYEAKIKSLELKPEETDKKVAEAVKVVEETGGEVKIGELAKTVGLSIRQLERRFRRISGFSPKQYARARRIRATAVSLVEEAEMSWANRAAEMGFTDQSHLTHEFSALTGRSPNSFAERVKRIEHGELSK
jgi:AraC-like DNA-binding protein